MKYWKQAIAVTRWEYSRFFKPKNEIIGIIVMAIVSVVFYVGSKYAFSRDDKGAEHTRDKMEISVLMDEDIDDALIETLKNHYVVNRVPAEGKAALIERLKQEGDDVLLEEKPGGFTVYAYKSTHTVERLKADLNEFHKQREMQEIGLSYDELNAVLTPVPLSESFFNTDNSTTGLVLAYFFAGLTIMAVFLSFAYQFTAITGEKQLKITEQIVSAISPQTWMDGKIVGITLVGISSMFTYAIFSIVGGVLFFQFKGMAASDILKYLHVPSLLLFLPFALTGILLWNAVLAAVASIITDPNTSGKSSLMMLPVAFVAASFMVTRDPDSGFSVFLSWFPFTSATSMPMRWATTDVGFGQLAGSFLLLVLTFYFLRKMAAKIFRMSILITGKEPTWGEVIKLLKHS